MGTYTHTQTITDARYVAAKIAADLKRLQRLAGQGVPSDVNILNYQIEAVQLLHGGYLDTVTYGFRRGEGWVLALQYSATSTGHLSDSDPGGIVHKDVTGASFGSYLTYSNRWLQLSDGEKEDYERKLPFARSPGAEPNGRWDSYDNNYQSGGIGVRRRRTTL